MVSRAFLYALLLGFFTSLGTNTGLSEEPKSIPFSDLMESDERLPGVALAQGISEVTGVAISPLLGVSGVGAWKYYSTPAELRNQLPWFCHPVAWGIGFGILSLVVLKDVLGTGAPALLKKPLDFVELFEDKLSAIVAGSAIVPYIAKGVSQYLAETPESVFYIPPDSAYFVAIAPVALAWILVPLAICGFAVVWLLSHAINVLILFSPFGIVDALLKLSKLALLSALVLFYFLSPILAAVLASIIILVAAILAPATFRLCVFGSVMSYDYLRSLIWKSETATSSHGFLARRSDSGMKSRTMGKVVRTDDGDLVFVSRFLFFGPSRKLVLPDNESTALHRGVLFPSLTVEREETKRRAALVHFLPRYRHAVESLAERLCIDKFTENPVVRGFKAIAAWSRGAARTARLRISAPKEDDA